MVGRNPVKNSFSIGQDTRLNTRFQKVRTLGYKLVFKWSGHTEIKSCFQMVCKHPVTHSFLNGSDTHGYTVIFKCSEHTQLHPRFQKTVPH